ncbi:toll/interleukin-1 receptor domain-containing protein [Methylobacterium radiotolerans]|uniref:toll/interleukin-1 receptor domain-containing protein n=1 Tax=Methylobacterium radiotolerans TaxID=31998 RepID=UPI000D5DB5FD|nr:MULTISPECIES: toll/interleukin-1 receptor domain-containing protein [Methylobacterium]MDE3749579.1 toll/interleukin-1 receptor domain-containing protein [Methylobacterium radiotolerans]PVZ05940.1 TIR domain-containing protein [Methylobacterium organophilum]
MPPSTRPFLVIYVAWHPAFAPGRSIAKGLYDHFRRELYENVAGGTGLSVLYRSEIDPHSGALRYIDLDESETTAVVPLIDARFAEDASYMAWIRELADRVDQAGLRARVFPVAIDGAFGRAGLMHQAVRWDSWRGVKQADRRRRLVSDLTYQFGRMLRAYLERLRRPHEPEEELDRYLRKVQIFLSHSKHDPDGERIARTIRDALYKGDGLSTFFDVHDIPTGVRFDDVILRQVRVSAVVAIHTDGYSSREWCRREIIEAKRWNVPLVIANCISEGDERGFPYMGNVPIVRLDPRAVDRIDHVVGRLLDEVLKDFLWRCRIELARTDAPDDAVFLPRPPELISLAGLEGRADADVTLIYPDPPLGAEERRLFEVIAPKVQLRSLTEWLAGWDGEITG